MMRLVVLGFFAIGLGCASDGSSSSIDDGVSCTEVCERVEECLGAPVPECGSECSRFSKACRECLASASCSTPDACDQACTASSDAGIAPDSGTPDGGTSDARNACGRDDMPEGCRATAFVSCSGNETGYECCEAVATSPGSGCRSEGRHTSGSSFINDFCCP